MKGNGHQITGQKIPLFEKISGGSVEGLILTDGEIIRPNEERVAALAKDAWDGSYIQDVYVRNMKIQGQTLVGGLVGHLDNSTVRGCSVVAQVDGREAGWIYFQYYECEYCNRLLCTAYDGSENIWR